MTLADLVREALGLEVLGTAVPGPETLPDVEVRGVAQDSRRVEPGFVFVARRGALQDAHAYVPEAVRRGAVAVVGEASEAERREGGWAGPGSPLSVPYLQVKSDKAALARLAAAFHGRPSERLTVVGVTGTDGKTTTSTMLHWLLSSVHPTGLLSTAGCKVGLEAVTLPGHFTTPEATEVQAMLARFVAAGCTHAVLESSSHGFAQKRLDEVAYALGAVTNLSPEHLDYHGSFEAYRDAKAELVRRAPRAVLNADDPSLSFFASQAGEVVRYAVDAPAEWRALEVREERGGLRWRLVAETSSGRLETPVLLPMIGRYNVSNALAALASAHALGLEMQGLVQRLASFPGVPGRMQVVQAEPFAVVVDFAHTAPALEKALRVLRPQASGRLIVVVGAAGERDPGKRAPLGAVAATEADLALFTEEDPRSESLEGILARMAAGAVAAGGEEGKTFFRVPDRREAIARAVGLARAGDVVLLAGKGHETTLERGHETVPWDEAEEARQALARR